MGELRTDGLPESDRPGPGGEDSVQAIHKPVMDAMNNPVMGLTGDPEDEDDDPAARTAPGHADSVQAIHDVLMREQAEPRDGFEPVPMWVTMVFGALLMWGGFYIGANSGDFRRDVFDRPDVRPEIAGVKTETKDPDPQTVDELMKVGGLVYGTCAACHGPDGKGNRGQGYPPLAGSEWVAGAEASPARLARIVLYGLHQPITVSGATYNGQMPAWNSKKDYEIAGVLTYIRNSWGNKMDPDNAKPGITTAMVAAARAKEGKKRDPLTEAELRKIPLDFTDLAPVAPKKDDAKKDDTKK